MYCVKGWQEILQGSYLQNWASFWKYLMQDVDLVLSKDSEQTQFCDTKALEVCTLHVVILSLKYTQTLLPSQHNAQKGLDLRTASVIFVKKN